MIYSVLATVLLVAGFVRNSPDCASDSDLRAAPLEEQTILRRGQFLKPGSKVNKYLLKNSKFLF